MVPLTAQLGPTLFDPNIISLINCFEEASYRKNVISAQLAQLCSLSLSLFLREIPAPSPSLHLRRLVLVSTPEKSMADNLKSLAAKARLVRAQLRSHGQQVEQINNPRQREILNTDLEEMHERRENLIPERTKISLAFEQEKLQV